MKKVADFILKYKIFFIAFFLVAVIVSACLISQVSINYNLQNYLPKDSEITKAFDISAEEFGSNEVVMAMVANVEQGDIEGVITNLKGIDNVDSVMLNAYNAEKKAVLLNITFADKLENAKLKTAVDKIKNNTLDKKVYLSGNIMNDFFIQDTTTAETTKILLFLIPIVLLVLIFTSKSWLDPLICVGVMGIAILISMGTNVIFTGGVSFITQSILAALTMAISMDYSIFLLHAFKDERAKGVEAKQAVANALVKSFTTITVGSLTTVAGFAAMLIMKFGLGFDMGLVFAKTIIIALLTVLFFMPCILLLFHKAIEKTTHRNLFPSFRPIGKFAVKSRYVTAVIALLLLVPSIFGQFSNNFIYGFSSMTEAVGTTLYEDKKQIVETFNTGNQIVALHKNDGNLDNEFAMMNDFFAIKVKEKKDGKETEKSLVKKSNKEAYSLIVNSFLENGKTNFPQLLPMFGITEKTTLTELDTAFCDKASVLNLTINALAAQPDPANPMMQPIAMGLRAGIDTIVASKPMFLGKKQGYMRVILELDIPEEGTVTFNALDELKAKANLKYDGENYFMGLPQVAYDIKKVVEVDYIWVTVISVLAIFLLILIPFRKFSIPLILMFVIELGIFVNMAIPFYAGIAQSYISYLIISAVQLGCTIDYAILMMNKYKSYRKEFNPRGAAIESVNNAAPAIITSGGILTLVGVLINIISSNNLISETGGMLWRAGLLSMFFVFFLLPGLLVMFDRFVINHKKAGETLENPLPQDAIAAANAGDLAIAGNVTTNAQVQKFTVTASRISDDEYKDL